MAAYSDGGVQADPDDGVWMLRDGGETEQTSLTSGTARILMKENRVVQRKIEMGRKSGLLFVSKIQIDKQVI